MDLLAVGGCGARAGKTALIESLLAGPLFGWGALKTTPDPERHGRAPGYEFVTSPDILRAEGTDTRRYLDAGSPRVAWLSSARAPVATEITAALRHFAGLPGVVIEGIRLARPFSPGAWLLVAEAGSAEIKPEAESLIDGATWLAVRRPRGQAGGLSGALGSRLAAARAAFLVDPSDPRDAGMSALAAAVTAWLRSRP